jgi:hypothetical protein
MTTDMTTSARPSEPETAPTEDAEGTIRELFSRYGLVTALRHFSSAEDAFARGQWEAANGQVRSYLDALFEGVAAVRLKVSLRGGEARKRLEEEGILRPRQAAVVKAFMALAGERGAHAGISDFDDARSRRLLAFGVALIGLSLIPDLVRVGDVFAGTLKAPPGSQLPGDSEASTSCPTCAQEQRLDEAELTREEEATVYICKNGCQRLVVVAQPEDSAWEGRGFRLGSHVIRNAGDVYLTVAPGAPKVMIPASRAALMKERPSSG